MVLSAISKKKKIIFILVFLFCLFIQVIPVIRSGLNYNFGIGFWGPNGHDGIWHLSLINHISQPLKIDMPIFAGETLKNYHPFFDILIAFLSKITFINSSIWLFQIFPLISASLFLYFSFKLGQKLSGKFSGGLILMLLNTLNNSLGWLVTLIRSGSFNGESLFWAMQSPSNQLNPPYMLSILFLLILIYLLNDKNPKKIYIFLILIFLPVIKVYSAIPAFIIFGLYALNNKKYIKTLLLSIFFALILFLQYNSSSSSLIKFEPFWFTDSMIESIDRFYWPQIASFLHSPNIIKYIFAQIVAVAIFLIGNFAFRLLAVKEIYKEKSILISIIICTLIPLFFVQKGTSWNTIQFLYYALFLANIPLSVYLSKHSKLTYLVVILNIFPLIGSLPNFTGKIPPTAISKYELLALNFLKSEPKGIVLTHPYDAYLRKSFPKTPIPIYAYETNSYVSAYSKQQTFLEDEMNLENSSYNWQPRRQQAENFFSQKNEFVDRGFLVNNQIDYIYLPKIFLNQKTELSPKLSIKNIFENPEIVIYKVNR